MRGGSERYMFELIRMLEGHGHEVIPFSMTHEKNIASQYSNYFVSFIDYPTLLKSRPGIPEVIKVLERLIISREAKQKIKQLILDTRPDIVHIHAIGHEFSPSILKVVKSFNIPIVYTLHDYGLLCPNTNFISRGEICERCKGQRYYNIVLRRCKRDSLMASLLACISQYLTVLTNSYAHNVDVYIAPSHFLKNKLREHGFKKKIVVIPNSIDLNEYKPHMPRSRDCLYAGRLVAMKGIRTLLEAAKLASGVKILIAGDGELGEEMRKTIAAQGLENVNVLGFVQPQELSRLMSSMAFTVFPSECYENYPLSIVESFACGKPVIASNIGALPELVKENWNGLLFEPGNAQQLADQLKYLSDHPQQALEMGNHGREQTLAVNDPEVHYQRVMAVYQELLEPSSSL